MVENRAVHRQPGSYIIDLDLIFLIRTVWIRPRAIFENTYILLVFHLVTVLAKFGRATMKFVMRGMDGLQVH